MDQDTRYTVRFIAIFAFSISLAMLLPILFFVPLFGSFFEFIKMIPCFLWIFLKLSFVVFLVLLLVFRRVGTSLKDFKKPIVLSIAYMVNALTLLYLDFPGITPGDEQTFRSVGPICIVAWILFPIVYSEKFKRIKPIWLLKTIQYVIVAFIFYSGLTFLIIDGSLLFAKVFNL